MSSQVVLDSSDQVRDATEDTSSDSVLGNLPEPALDHVEPGTRCRNKVQVKTPMLLEPPFDRGALMGSIVVDDEVKVQSSGRLFVNVLEKSDKLTGAMSGHTLSDDRPIQHVQCGK